MISTLFTGSTGHELKAAAYEYARSKAQISRWENNVDVIVIGGEDQTAIKIEQIRQLKDEIFILPIQHEHKVCLIEQADLMTLPAQNALLKVLEEPPEHVLIMLLSERVQFLLPTIQSRCSVIRVSSRSENMVESDAFWTREGIDQYLEIQKLKGRAEAQQWLTDRLGNLHRNWIESSADMQTEERVRASLHALKLLERNVNVSLAMDWWIRHVV